MDPSDWYFLKGTSCTWSATVSGSVQVHRLTLCRRSIAARRIFCWFLFRSACCPNVRALDVRASYRAMADATETLKESTKPGAWGMMIVLSANFRASLLTPAQGSITRVTSYVSCHRVITSRNLSIWADRYTYPRHIWILGWVEKDFWTTFCSLASGCALP